MWDNVNFCFPFPLLIWFWPLVCIRVCFTDPSRGRPAGPFLCPGGLCGARGLLHGLSPVRPHPVGPQVCLRRGTGQETLGINRKNCCFLWDKIIVNETVCCLFLLNEESCMCTLNCMHILNTGDDEFHISHCDYRTASDNSWHWLRLGFPGSGGSRDPHLI